MSHFPAFPSRPDVVGWWARVQPGRVALVDRRRDARLTYAELDAASATWARALHALGVGRGDRVAVLAGNRGELPALFGACLRVGAVILPLNWRLAAPELAPIVADAAPAVLIGESRFRAVAEQAVGRGAGGAPRWVDLDDDAPALLRRAASAPEVPEVRAAPDAPTMLLYTSGSTGAPKGAVLPHRQLLHNAVATAVGWELGASDVAPVTTPFFHTGGWHVFTTPILHVGGTVVLFEQFDAATFLDDLAEERCTVAFCVPTQIAMLADGPSWGRPLPDLRWLISGGAPCPPALAERVRGAGIDFREGFGLTECGPNCFAIGGAAARARPGSVGWPALFLEMRLDAGGGREAEPGEPGELLLRGPQLFAGYWNAPARTAEAVDAEGWLHTGDLASRDADGAYRICGRRKEMFISGGENVFPGEVEAALAECDGVAEVIVVGVPDAKWGEVGRAFVVPRAAGRAAGSEELAGLVVAHARRRLAGYKVPKSVIVLDELPRLGSGKPDRRALAAWTVPGAADANDARTAHARRG
ncbi:MAG: class I adenylate-forming enzyme family protein [Gemmatimonadaceae bacterium]